MDTDSELSKQAWSEEWSNYVKRVRRYRNERIAKDPGLFAKGIAQYYYEQCLSCPLPLPTFAGTSVTSRITSVEMSNLTIMPILTLPLRVHIIRSDMLGCSSALNPDSVRTIIDMVNHTYWQPQAGIRFELIQINEPRINNYNSNKNNNNDTQQSSVPVPESESGEDSASLHVDEAAIKAFIMEKLRRGPDGTMMHKSERRRCFLDTLLASFGYNCNCNDAYDVWFLDMVGHGSQGMCIDRKTHTVLMGERSTKGYNVPTARPHDCLTKTMAHELGHALQLNHPRNMYFTDGQHQIIHSEKKNLMQGGIDRKGGGGYFLEQWQICLARDAAKRFLKRSRN